MTCCQIASGCGIPVSGCVGTIVATGHVLVDLSVGQMPLYVDTCTGSIYYFDGTKWIVLGKNNKYLLYDAASRVLTLQPDGSSVQLPLASSTIAGLVKVNNGSPISVTTDGTLVIDCAALKAACNLLDKSLVPTGNVIYYNTTTNMLDVDCAKLKTQCGLASTTDLPISGPVVKIDPSTKQLQVDCAALKTQCNLASIDQIPAIPTYNFGQQAAFNPATNILHIANTQNPAAGVDVDLSSLAGGGSTPSTGGGAQDYLFSAPITNNSGGLSYSIYAQNRTKYGKLISIEIVANKVWNGYIGNYVTPTVFTPSAVLIQDDTHTPFSLLQGTKLPIVGENQGYGYSLYCKFFEGGIILRYENGSVTNTDVCGAPFGIKSLDFHQLG